MYGKHQGQGRSRKSGGSKHQSGAGGKQTTTYTKPHGGATLHQRTTAATSAHQSNMKMSHQGQHGGMAGGTSHPRTTSAGKKPGKGSISGTNRGPKAPKGSGTY